MPQNKKPLEIIFVEQLGVQEAEYAQKLKTKFPAWDRLPREKCRQPYLAVAYIACHPAILEDREQTANRDFAYCFKLRPDEVIDALRMVRKWLKEHGDKTQKQAKRDARWKSGRVRSFFKEHQFVVKKDGQFILPEKLNPVIFSRTRSSYAASSRLRTLTARALSIHVTGQLLSPLKYIAVNTLTDGELGQILNLEPDTVKKARQSLSTKGKP